MACNRRDCKAIPKALPDAVVSSLIGDASNSSLSATQAAETVLCKVNGIGSNQLLTAAIELIREHAHRLVELDEDHAGEIADFEDKVSDLKIEIGDLHRLRKVGVNASEATA
jgi:hypothetical protein